MPSPGGSHRPPPITSTSIGEEGLGNGSPGRRGRGARRGSSGSGAGSSIQEGQGPIQQWDSSKLKLIPEDGHRRHESNKDEKGKLRDAWGHYSSVNSATQSTVTRHAALVTLANVNTFLASMSSGYTVNRNKAMQWTWQPPHKIPGIVEQTIDLVRSSDAEFRSASERLQFPASLGPPLKEGGRSRGSVDHRGGRQQQLGRHAPIAMNRAPGDPSYPGRDEEEGVDQSKAVVAVSGGGGFLPDPDEITRGGMVWGASWKSKAMEKKDGADDIASASTLLGDKGILLGRGSAINLIGGVKKNQDQKEKHVMRPETPVNAVMAKAWQTFDRWKEEGHGHSQALMRPRGQATDQGGESVAKSRRGGRAQASSMMVMTSSPGMSMVMTSRDYARGRGVGITGFRPENDAGKVGGLLSEVSEVSTSKSPVSSKRDLDVGRRLSRVPKHKLSSPHVEQVRGADPGAFLRRAYGAVMDLLPGDDDASDGEWGETASRASSGRPGRGGSVLGEGGLETYDLSGDGGVFQGGGGYGQLGGMIDHHGVQRVNSDAAAAAAAAVATNDATTDTAAAAAAAVSGADVGSDSATLSGVDVGSDSATLSGADVGSDSATLSGADVGSDSATLSGADVSGTNVGSDSTTVSNANIGRSGSDQGGEEQQRQQQVTVGDDGKNDETTAACSSATHMQAVTVTSPRGRIGSPMLFVAGVSPRGRIVEHGDVPPVPSSLVRLVPPGLMQMVDPARGGAKIGGEIDQRQRGGGVGDEESGACAGDGGGGDDPNQRVPFDWDAVLSDRRKKLAAQREGKLAVKGRASSTFLVANATYMEGKRRSPGGEEGGVLGGGRGKVAVVDGSLLRPVWRVDSPHRQENYADTTARHISSNGIAGTGLSPERGSPTSDARDTRGGSKGGSKSQAGVKAGWDGRLPRIEVVSPAKRDALGGSKSAEPALGRVEEMLEREVEAGGGKGMGALQKRDEWLVSRERPMMMRTASRESQASWVAKDVLMDDWEEVGAIDELSASGWGGGMGVRGTPVNQALASPMIGWSTSKGGVGGKKGVGGVDGKGVGGGIGSVERRPAAGASPKRVG